MKVYYGSRPSRNLIPFPYDYGSIENNGLVITVLQDGGIQVNGTCTAQTVFFLSTKIEWFTAYVYATAGRFAINNGLCLSLTVNKTVSPAVPYVACESKRRLYLLFRSGEVYDNVVFYPMLNEGKTPKPYERGSKNYPQRVKAIKRKLTTKTVTVRNPKNLIPFPYAESSMKRNGGEITTNVDGGITASGTPTDYIGLNIRGKIKVTTDLICSLYGNAKNVVGQVEYFSIAGRSLGSVRVYPNKPLKISKTDYAELDYVALSVKRESNNIEMSGTVYPMLNEGTAAEPYFVEQDVPYYVPVLCDVELPIDTQTNLIPFPHTIGDLYSTNYYNGYTITNAGITYTMQEDGGIRLSGTVTGASYSFCIFCWPKYNFPNAGTYTFILYGEDNPKIKFEMRALKDGVENYRKLLKLNEYATCTFADDERIQRLAIIVNGEGTTVDTIVYPKLNRGDKPTPWYPRNEEVN